jgi:SHS2 domain-containing protein
MFAYMTDLDAVEERSTLQIEVSGHDLQSALYAFLDEWLFSFSADPYFVPFKVEIVEMQRPAASLSHEQDSRVQEGEGVVVIKAVGYGETFDLKKHPQGTEVKAITYSAMQINEYQDFAELFVIIDI